MLVYYGIGFLLILTGFAVKGNLKIGEESLSRRKKACYLAAAFGIMLFFSAMRDVSVGTDTKHYLQIYEWLNQSDTFGRYEPGFALLNIFVGRYLGDFQWVIVLSSIIMIVPYAIYIYKESEDVVFSTIIFFFYYFISFSTMMRQGMAMGIVMLALLCYKRKKRLLFILLVLLASTFHSSAWFALIIPIFSKLRYSFISFVLCAGSAYLLGRLNFFRDLMSNLEFDSSYIGETGAGGTNALMLSCITLAMLATFYWVGGSSDTGHVQIIDFRKFESYNFEILMTILYTVFQITTISIPVMARVSDYYSAGFLTLVPNKLARDANGREKLIVYTVLILIFCIYQYIVFTYRPLWGGFVPYSFFWQA